jgi:hypothetical protein
MKISKIINHSLEPDWQILQWFDARFYNDFLVEAVVLPDVCPAGIMPNGTMAITKKDWLSTFAFRQAIGDIGCAMSQAVIKHFDLDLLPRAWNHLYRKLKGLNKTILGSGNHFIDACINNANQLVILVHVGSRMTSPEKKEFHSRGEAKEIEVDQQALRQRIIIPDELDDHSWRLESPVHYRKSADILSAVESFIEVTDQLLPIAFMGGF